MTIKLITPLSKKQILYRDFKKDLSLNPLTNDLSVFTNEDAVKDSIKNLVLTDKGERLFQPQIGGNIRQTLFDLMTPASLKILEEQVREVINNFEPRAQLIDVTVRGIYDENKVQISIRFYIRNNENPISLNLFLERTR